MGPNSPQKPTQPPWYGKWARPDDVQGHVRVIAQATEEPVHFYFPRQLLLNSCEFFVDALSWSESSGENSQAKAMTKPSEGTTAGRTGLDAAVDASPPQPNDEAPDNTPDILFLEDPYTVSNMLAFISAPGALVLRPDTVEPLLELASMIGLDALVERCGRDLVRKLCWDPVGTLELAHECQAAELYTAAVDAVMKTHESNEQERIERLSQPVIDKLHTYRRAVFQALARITVNAVSGGFHACTSVGNHPLGWGAGLVREVSRIGLSPLPGEMDAIFSKAARALRCDLTEVVKSETQSTISLGLEGTARQELIDEHEAPDEFIFLLCWTAARSSGVLFPNCDAEQVASAILKFLRFSQTRRSSNQAHAVDSGLSICDDRMQNLLVLMRHYI